MKYIYTYSTIKGISYETSIQSALPATAAVSINLGLFDT